MEGLADILELGVGAEPPQERMLQIFGEACRLFATRGFQGTSMRDIAEECGISKATLYHYFPDKDAILRPLVLGVTKALHRHVAAGIRAEDPPLEKLRCYMTGSAAFFARHRWAMIASSSVFWTDPQARRRRERLEWRDRYEALLRAILREAVERREIRAGLDIPLAGRLVLSTLNWLPRWFDPAGPLTAPQIAERFHGMVVAGLRDGAAVGLPESRRGA